MTECKPLFGACSSQAGCPHLTPIPPPTQYPKLSATLWPILHRQQIQATREFLKDPGGGGPMEKSAGKKMCWLVTPCIVDVPTLPPAAHFLPRQAASRRPPPRHGRPPQRPAACPGVPQEPTRPHLLPAPGHTHRYRRCRPGPHHPVHSGHRDHRDGRVHRHRGRPREPRRPGGAAGPPGAPEQTPSCASDNGTNSWGGVPETSPLWRSLLRLMLPEGWVALLGASRKEPGLEREPAEQCAIDGHNGGSRRCAFENAKFKEKFFFLKVLKTLNGEPGCLELGSWFSPAQPG